VILLIKKEEEGRRGDDGRETEEGRDGRGEDGREEADVVWEVVKEEERVGRKRG
jgi:hypothetical protein